MNLLNLSPEIQEQILFLSDDEARKQRCFLNEISNPGRQARVG